MMIFGSNFVPAYRFFFGFFQYSRSSILSKANTNSYGFTTPTVEVTSHKSWLGTASRKRVKRRNHVTDRSSVKLGPWSTGSPTGA